MSYNGSKSIYQNNITANKFTLFGVTYNLVPYLYSYNAYLKNNYNLRMEKY